MFMPMLGMTDGIAPVAGLGAGALGVATAAGGAGEAGGAASGVLACALAGLDLKNLNRDMVRL
jgi:hypothetical protein